MMNYVLQYALYCVDIIMMLCKSVALIVVKYLRPSCLEEFFRMEGLDRGMVFEYDDSGTEIGCEKLYYVLNRFPNMVLRGMMVSENSKIHKFMMIRERFAGLVRYGLRDNCINLCLFPRCIKHIANVREFHVINYCGVYDIAYIFGRVKCLRFSCDDGSRGFCLRWISKCVGLEKVVINDGVRVGYEEFDELSKCEGVRYLSLSVTIETKCPLRMAGLRVLILRNMGIYDLEIVKGCRNLERLVIENCANLMDVGEIVKECPGLKSLVIRGCGRVDISTIFGLVLVRIKIC